MTAPVNVKEKIFFENNSIIMFDTIASTAIEISGGSIILPIEKIFIKHATAPILMIANLSSINKVPGKKIRIAIADIKAPPKGILKACIYEPAVISVIPQMPPKIPINAKFRDLFF